MSNDTLVFIPAWNEEENLPAVLDDDIGFRAAGFSAGHGSDASGTGRKSAVPPASDAPAYAPGATDQPARGEDGGA